MKMKDFDWPIFGWAADIRTALRIAVGGGRHTVLATLIRLEGSAPRPAHTQMLFDGSVATGYFSGGCLEADVANHAASVLEDGQPRFLVYGQGSPWIDIRLACGGQMEILLERLAPDDWAVDQLLAFERQRRCLYWSSDGAQRRVGDRPADPLALEGSRPHYSLHYLPVWRIIIIGGDPTALAIAQLAAMAGFEVALIRPGGPQAPPPIVGIGYHRGSVTTSLDSIGVDRWTAIVAATHDVDLDDEALVYAVKAGAGYAGVLGAANGTASREARLRDAGISAEALAAIRAPIGLRNLGKAPWEVATSIIAEIMQTRTELEPALPEVSAKACVAD